MTCHEETTVATVVNGQEAIKVARDELDTSPREWSNLGVISMRSSSDNYSGLGEETYHTYGCECDSDEPGECGKELFADTLAHLPLFVDDWGWKTVIRTAPNRDGEAPDGYIYATDKQAIAMGCTSKRSGKPSARLAKRMLRDEIASYNQWLAGEVYMVTHVRTERCDRGADHEEVLECIGGVYPPYDGNIDEDGRCKWLAWGMLGRINPADEAVKQFIDDFIGGGEGADGAREALGWYRAAAACADLSDEARNYWAWEAKKLASGSARAAAATAAAPHAPASGSGARGKGSGA